jgi:alpha-L-fucosidase 2
VVRLACDAPGRLSASICLDSLPRHEVAARGDDVLLLSGQCPAHVDPNYLQTEEPVRYAEDAGMRFAVHLRATVEGGAVEAEKDALRVRGADALTLRPLPRRKKRQRDCGPLPRGRCSAALCCSPGTARR